MDDRPSVVPKPLASRAIQQWWNLRGIIVVTTQSTIQDYKIENLVEVRGLEGVGVRGQARLHNAGL